MQFLVQQQYLTLGAAVPGTFYYNSICGTTGTSVYSVQQFIPTSLHDSLRGDLRLLSHEL